MADDDYIVLARKHRPRHFDQVVGQDHIARTLSNSIQQNRIAHAMLFTGARGIGKTSMARILARALNCQEGPTPTPCDRCPSCLEIARGSSVDVIEIDAASNRGIDDIRDLREAVRYPPSRERYKVYIIDEVHMLTTPAFNALLKTLEEPPRQVVFIFATTEHHKIPDTIRSRCQRYDFRRISNEQIAAHLASIAVQEGVVVEIEALELIARQSEGCMRDAQSLLDQLISFASGEITAELASRILGVVGRSSLFSLSRALLERNVPEVLKIVEDAYGLGVNLVQFCGDLSSHIRDLTVAALSSQEAGLIHLNQRERQQLTEIASLGEVSQFHRMFTLLVEAGEEMSRSAYPRLILEMALLRMTALEPLQPLGTLISRLEHLLGTGNAGSPMAAANTAGVKPAALANASPAPSPTPPRPTSRPKDSRGNGGAKPSSPRRTTCSAAGEPADQLDERARLWCRLVEAVSERSRTVGELLKVADLVPGQGASFTVCLPGATYDIIQDSLKMRLINEVAREVLGDEATIAIKLRELESSPESAGSFNLVREEERHRERQLERQAQIIREHPATLLLQETFGPSDLKIRPQTIEDESMKEQEP